MEDQHPPNELRTKLRGLGPMRPEAWQLIMQLGHHRRLATGQSLVRTPGSLAYLATGLLKEYDAHQRSQPAIINFIGPGQCIPTPRHNQHHYLKADTPSQLYVWDSKAIWQLYQSFGELEPIYDGLCAEYNAKILLRMRLMEMPVQLRLDAFRSVFKDLLPYLKKKDMANYLSINYSYLIDIWNY